MNYTEREVLQFVEENDVKFVKLMFCDVFGNLKAVSVLSSELPKIFNDGYAFDASAVDGFMEVCDMDLVLRPVLDTLSLLPWRPQQGRVMRLLCSICRADGTPFEGDGRYYLSQAVERAKKAGLDFKIGTTCEFYVFELDDKGIPTKIPHDTAGACDIAPADRGENLRRDICMTLEQMEIYPNSSRHEAGPGQNEIEFNSASPLNAADNLITFKNTVKSVSGRNGLYASFMPKPLPDKNGSSLHITISCTKNGANVFEMKNGSLSTIGGRMLGGIMKNLPAMSAFFNGVTNSYARLEAMKNMNSAVWTDCNLNVPVRLKNSGRMNGVVVRTPDNTCNPYFAIGLIINACMDGITSACEAPSPVNSKEQLSQLEDAVRLPADLEEAVKAAENSSFVKSAINDRVREYILNKKREMCRDYAEAQNKEIYETVKYFYSL